MHREVERLVGLYDRAGLLRRQLLQGLFALGVGPYVAGPFAGDLGEVGQAAPLFHSCRPLVKVALAACLSIAAGPVHGQQTPARVAEFLRQRIGLDSMQLKAVESGKAVVKLLDTRNSRDVAVFGIIAIDRPRGLYVARVHDAGNWLRAPNRRFGIFRIPASAADVRDVTIDSSDVEDLKNCHPGDCVDKLPATAMQRLHEEIDFSAPDRAEQTNAFARRRMVEYVTEYRAHGRRALVVYDDRGKGRVSNAFDSLLAQSPYLYQYSPELHKYLADYPHATLDNVRDVLYWSREAMPSVRPILSITHLAVYAAPDSLGMTLVAAKQIYADHYFEGAFDLMAVVDGPASTARPGIYLIVVRRFRFDNLPSGGLLNVRGKVVGKLQDRLRSDLIHEKTTSEKSP